MNSRQEIIEEQILREQIRKVIRIVKGRKKVQLILLLGQIALLRTT